MKIAVLSESGVDEAVVRILVNGILGAETEPIAPPRLRMRGWPSVRDVVQTVVRHLHYRTDADGLVVVIDSDDSAPHDSSHDEPDAAPGDCRLCQVRERIARTQGTLRPVATRSPLHVAVGLAVPCIEAWFRCGLDAHVTEAAWSRQLGTGGGFREQRLALKRRVYGTDRPPPERKRSRAMEEARRLVQNLEQLERLFPGGFGALAQQVHAWSYQPGSTG